MTGDNGDIAEPEENCEYPVVLGQSLLTGSDEVQADHARREEAGSDAAYALFQYKFTPASVDATIPGLVSIDDSASATVLRGTTAKSSEGGITFKGKIAEQKDTECLLIFDGSTFRLERCDYVVSQLRHVRTVPSQPTRPPPSAYPAPVAKKDLRLKGAPRLGKIVKHAKTAKKMTPKSAVSSVATASSEPSEDVMADQASVSATGESVAGDRGAVDPPSTKRQRLE